jgi:hypothetical protein
LNGKSDPVETAIDSVADARPAIQIAHNLGIHPGAAARDAAIIFVLARPCESDRFFD